MLQMCFALETKSVFRVINVVVKDNAMTPAIKIRKQ